MKTNVQLGYDVTQGCVLYLSKLLLLLGVFVILLTFVFGAFDLFTDDTDKDGFNRSGLRLLRDHGTGIEYLSDGKGGLVRRF